MEKEKQAKRSLRFIHAVIAIAALLLAFVTAANVIVIMGERETIQYKVVARIPYITKNNPLTDFSLTDTDTVKTGYYKSVKVAIYADKELTDCVTVWKSSGLSAQFKTTRSFVGGTEDLTISLTEEGLREANESSPVIKGQTGYGGCYMVVSYDYTVLTETAYAVRKYTLEVWSGLKSVFN